LNKRPSRSWTYFPAYQLVPIGVTFGKRFYGFAEAGYGFQYQGGRAGIGWKF